MSFCPLKSKIQADMSAAMRAKDAVLLGAIRLLWAAIRQREIDERIEADDVLILAVIDKMIKQRQDSITQYLAGGRAELAAAEGREIDVLKAYLPAELSWQKIEEIVANAILLVQASTIKDMGKVMAEVKPKVQGRADIAKVSSLIKDKLQK